MTSPNNKRQPPKEYQFQPGESGNPYGRPRKAVRAHIPSQIRKDVLKIAGRKVKRPGTDEEITIMEAYFLTIATLAIKGNPTAMKLFGDYLRVALTENLERNPAYKRVDDLVSIMLKQGVAPHEGIYRTIKGLAKDSMSDRQK